MNKPLKYIVFLFICTIALLSFALKANSQSDIVNIERSVEVSINSMSTSEMTRLMEDEIELHIETENIHYTKVKKDRATFLLDSFLMKNPPKSLDLHPVNGSKANITYLVGQFISGSKKFQTYLYLKTNEDGQFEIYSIEISRY